MSFKSIVLIMVAVLLQPMCCAISVPIYRTIVDRKTMSKSILKKFSKFVYFSEKRNLLNTVSEVDFEELKNYQALQYYGSILIGSQLFNVMFDTGSGNLFVTDSYLCNSCNSSHSYNCHLSKTCSRTTEHGIIEYGSGLASLWFYEDILEISGKKASVTFGAAIADNTGLVYDVNGIFGLSFPKLASKNITPPYDEIYNQNPGLIKEFAFYLSITPGIPSELVLYGHSADHFVGEIYYTTIIDDSYYMVNCPSISSDGYNIATNTSCIIDSGSSWIIGPKRYIQNMFKNVFKKYQFVKYNEKSGIMITDCEQSVLLPDVDIRIGDKIFTLTSADYVQFHDNQCFVAFTHLNMNVWVLGDTFMIKYYSIFDIANNRMGFALASNNTV